jgi:hypothetical protein
MRADVSDRDRGRIRNLACAALTGTACFVIAILLLHFAQPELSPLDEAVSYYVHGAHGWLMTVGLVAIGAGSMALAVGLSQVFEGRQARVGIALLAVWSIGTILGGVFAADPPGNWERPPSLSGAIHGVSAMVALAAFPVAAILISRQFPHVPALQPAAAAARLLANASIISYVAFMGSLVPVFVRPGPPVLFGLTERILLAVYAAWLCVAALSLVRMNRPSAS